MIPCFYHLTFNAMKSLNFPRFQYSDLKKFEDVSEYLQIYLTNDVINIIKRHLKSTIEIQSNCVVHYFNLEKRWRYLENLNEKYLKEYYNSLPSKEKIVLFSTSNYSNTGLTKEQSLKNKYLMIESISSYERRRISSYEIPRTKSCSDITDTKKDNCHEYNEIWSVSDLTLSNWLIKWKKRGLYGPALYYWPTYTKHIDEKNKEATRMFISSRIRPKKITLSLVKSLTHTI
jgi:hypothetical protein